jgi:phosphopantothenate synthetase
MARYAVSAEDRMLDVIKGLLVERGVVIVSRGEMFDTLVIETNDPLTVSQIEEVLEIRAAP